jgi:hypothetical protein
VSPDVINRILVVGALAGVLLLVLALIDFLINRWKYFKLFGHWLRKRLLRFKNDPTFAILHIPPEKPITSTSTPDGVHKTLKKFIFRGTQQQLMASETTRDGFPGTRYFVEFITAGQKPKSCSTPSRDEANAQWLVWYEQWEKQPGGFGGTFGSGIGVKRPF